MTKNSNGAVIYEGPSEINGAPIVAIATGLVRPSANRKTGPMIQVWILAQDGSPVEALKDGTDSAVCGSCRLRGELGKNRACYVNVGKAPNAVWEAWKAGSYPTWSGYPFHLPVRLGAYGDPAALPQTQLDRIFAAAAKGWTAYTHQWQSETLGGAINMMTMMASVDSEEERRAAEKIGWRTFRVVSDSADIDENEVFCPAIPGGDARARVICAFCGLCNGARNVYDGRKSIAVLAHGSGAKYAPANTVNHA